MALTWFERLQGTVVPGSLPFGTDFPRSLPRRTWATTRRLVLSPFPPGSTRTNGNDHTSTLEGRMRRPSLQMPISGSGTVWGVDVTRVKGRDRRVSDGEPWASRPMKDGLTLES